MDTIKGHYSVLFRQRLLSAVALPWPLGLRCAVWEAAVHAARPVLPVPPLALSMQRPLSAAALPPPPRLALHS